MCSNISVYLLKNAPGDCWLQIAHNTHSSIDRVNWPLFSASFCVASLLFSVVRTPFQAKYFTSNEMQTTSNEICTPFRSQNSALFRCCSWCCFVLLFPILFVHFEVVFVYSVLLSGQRSQIIVLVAIIRISNVCMLSIQPNASTQYCSVDFYLFRTHNELKQSAPTENKIWLCVYATVEFNVGNGARELSTICITKIYQHFSVRMWHKSTSIAASRANADESDTARKKVSKCAHYAGCWHFVVRFSFAWHALCVIVVIILDLLPPPHMDEMCISCNGCFGLTQKTANHCWHFSPSDANQTDWNFDRNHFQFQLNHTASCAKWNKMTKKKLNGNNNDRMQTEHKNYASRIHMRLCAHTARTQP